MGEQAKKTALRINPVLSLRGQHHRWRHRERVRGVQREGSPLTLAETEFKYGG